MHRVKKMQTEQSIKVRPKIVPVRTNLESIFEGLVEEFELTPKDIKLGIDMIRDSKAGGDKYSLHYQKFWMDEDVQDEGLVYNGELFGHLEIYAYTNFGKPFLNYEVPSAKIPGYRRFLAGISEKISDKNGNLADRIVFGSFLPEVNMVGRKNKRFYQKLELVDFSEVYDLILNHIKP